MFGFSGWERSSAPQADELLPLVQLGPVAGDDDELVAVGRQAIEALPAGPDGDWVAAVTVAGVGMRQRPQEALALAGRALAGHDLPMPSVLAEKARMLIHLGRPDEAVALAQGVFELGAEARIPMVAVGTLVDIAFYGGRSPTCAGCWHLA